MGGTSSGKEERKEGRLEATKERPVSMSEEDEEDDASDGGVGGGMDTFAGVGEFSSSPSLPSHPHTPPSQHPPKLKDLNMKQVKEAMLR